MQYTNNELNHEMYNLHIFQTKVIYSVRFFDGLNYIMYCTIYLFKFYF